MPPLARRWQQRQTHACVFPCFRPRRGREGWADEWEAQPLILQDHNKSLFSLRSVWENRAPYLIAASPALSFQKQPLNPLEQGDKSFHPSPVPQNRPEIPRLNSQEKQAELNSEALRVQEQRKELSGRVKTPPKALLDLDRVAGTGHLGSWEKSGIWLTASHFQITNAPGVATTLSATWIWSEPLDHALDSSVQQFPDK